MNLNVLLRDHELHIHCCDRWQHPAVKQCLCCEADAHLQFESLQLDVGVTFGLHEALLKFEVATVEGGREVVCFEHDCVVGDVVVKVDQFVIVLQVERVFNQIPLVALELDVRDFHVVDEGDDLVKNFVLRLTKRA